MTDLIKFISVEGGEGTGKSTFVAGLKTRLEQHRQSVLTTREPGGTAVADAIRNLFKNPPENEPILGLSELFMVSAARHQHLEHVIKPALNKGQWVICDRFYDSTRVYQGALAGVNHDFLEQVLSTSIGYCEPSLTFLLDCDLKTSLYRLAHRSTSDSRDDRFDAASKEQHQQLRQAFLALASSFLDRIIVVNASLTTEEMLNQAVAKIQSKFECELG